MKKIVFCMILILALTVFGIPSVSASVQVSTSLASNTLEVKSGEVVEVELAFTNFKEINKGINAYEGVLKYDQNIFEPVTQDNFVSQNGWEDLEYNPKNGKFVAIRKVGVKQDSHVVKIVLKVKNNAKATKTTIQVEDIVTSEGEKDIFLSNTSVILDIIKEQEVIPSNPDVDVPSRPNRPNYGSSSVAPVLGLGGNKNDLTLVDKDTHPLEEDTTHDSLQEDNTSQDDSYSTSTDEGLNSEVGENVQIKKTSNNYIILFIILIVVAILFIFFIYLRRKKDDDHNISYMSLIVFGILLTGFAYSTCVFAYNISLKGEVNGDSIISYDDVNLLEKHLIGLDQIVPERLENADMNMDGEITVTDLSLLIQKLENLLEFDVQITNLEVDNYYPNKNQDITMRFRAAVSYGEIIKKIVIDGKEYDIQLLEDRSYAIKLNVGKDAGKKDYIITDVILNNEKRVSVNNKLSIHVLKSTPSISNYRVENDMDNSKLIVLFDLVDPDNSMSVGQFSVYDKNQNSYIKERLVKGKNRIEIKVEESKEYQAHIDLQYNLSGIVDDSEHNGVVQYIKDLQLIMDYDFKISNIALYKDGIITTEFEHGDSAQLVFSSSNNTKHIPTSIKIDGKEYNVLVGNNNYFVTLSPFNTLGSHTSKIEEVTLSNGKRFVLDNQSVSFEVVKKKPSISSIDVVENTKDKNVKVKFNLDDMDDAVKEVHIDLFDIHGTLISNKVISSTQIKDDQVIGTLDTFENMSTKYKVVVTVHYSLNDQDVIEEVLAEKEVAALPKVKVKSVVPNSNYALKNGSLKLVYDFESNVVGNITKIRVNNVNYSAIKRADGKYEIDVNVIDVSGLYSLMTSKVIYHDGIEVDTDAALSIEILKDKPFVQNYVFDTDLINSAILLNFDIVDLENSFIDGKIVLKSNGQEVISKKVTKGHNEIALGVVPLQKYVMEIRMDYDLDDHLLENSPSEDNRVTDEVVFSREVEFVADYQLKVENIQTYNGTVQSQTFNKGDLIKVCFESTNVANLDPARVIINNKTYDVVKENGVYSAVIDSFDTIGKQVIRIEKIILSNGKELEVKDQNEVEIYINKTLPSVTNIHTTENKQLDVSFNLVDIDKTVEYIDLELLNASGNQISNKRIEKDQIQNGLIESSLSTQMTSKYQLVIKAHYSLNGQDFVDGVLATKDISPLPKINIKDVTTSSSSVVKNGFVKLIYDFESNRLEDINRIVVNNVSYPVKKLSSSKYEVEVAVGNTVGDYLLHTTQVVYSESVSVLVDHSVYVKILKDRPFASNISTQEKDDELKVSFNLVDVDKTIEYIDIDLFNEKGEKISSKKIEKSQINTEVVQSSLNTQMASKYKIAIKAHYSLDAENFIDEVLAEKEVNAIPKVNIKSMVSNSDYVLKNGSVKITYTFESNRLDDINRIVVNSISYPVKKLSSSKYEVEVLAGSVSGPYSLKTTQIVYVDGVTVDVDATLNVNILKDEPFINNYKLTDNLDKGTVILDFDVVDKDESLKNIYAVLDGEKLDDQINKGHNTLTLKVTPSKKYLFDIKATYDLGDKNIITDKTLYTTQIELIEDYQLQISNMKIYKDGKETSILDKDDTAQLIFDSVNHTTHIPTSIKVGEKEYSVVVENGHYVASLDCFDTLGSHTLVIDEVTLSNGKKIKLSDHNSITVQVNKRKPVISDELTITENIELNSLKVMFNLEDKDKALVGVSILVMNAEDKEISRVKLTNAELEQAGMINKFLDIEMTSKYKVKVFVSYNLTGKDTDVVKDEIFKEQEVAASPRVHVKSVLASSDYVNKNGSVSFIYELESNKVEDISKIHINNKDYDVVKLSNLTYQVTISNIGSTSGVKKYTANKVIYHDGKEANINKTVSIDVLKDRPSVSNFVLDTDLDTKEVILDFDVVDREHSFQSGKAVLALNGNKLEKSIKVGHNTLRFKVKPLEKYILEIKSTYDLDSNTLSGKPDTDNCFTDVVIDTREVSLIDDYSFAIQNIKTYNEKGETKYFGKNEPIKVSFERASLGDFEPVKVVINGKEYPLEKKDSLYYLTISSHKTVGVKTAKIEKVIFNDSKEMLLTENNEIKVTVLKDKPVVEKFSYLENIDGTISVQFNLSDAEKTVTDGKVMIINHGTVIKEQKLKADANVIQFQPSANQNYTVKVIADYDLDMNVLEEDANEYKNMTLLETEITLGIRNFEMKDITDLSVYKQTTNGVVEVSSLRESDLKDLNNYIVKVNMKEMPTFYTTIVGYRIDNKKLKLTLAYDNIVQYIDNSKQDRLEVTYGDMVNGVAENISLESLIDSIEKNPAGTFTLTRDYDASLLMKSTNSIISATFTGTFNGNGYKIYNLSKPLFENLDSARIENLVLNNVTLSGANSRGALSNTASNTNIRNVYIEGLNLTTGANHSAGMLGEATNTTVEESSVTGFTINTAGHIRVSAIIGKLTDGSIKNCYVEGNLNSTQSRDGNGIGGILGHGFGTVTIENCISKVHISNGTGPRLNGAIVGIFASSTSILKNNVSLSTGSNFYSIHGNEPNSVAVNNYELADSGLVTNVFADRVHQVSLGELNGTFFKETAQFNENIWDLSQVSSDHPPVLKHYKENSGDAGDSSGTSELYIPGYNRIKNMSAYTSDKDILYHNLYKLMPYYDAKYLVEDGIKIVNNHLLATKAIQYVLPYSNGKLLTYLTAENYNTITDIKVVFNDLKIVTYSVHFKELNQNISIYELEGLGIDYAPNKYVIKNDSPIVNTIKSYIEGIDYATVLDPLTAAADVRHYKDHYNEVIKTLALDITLQLLQNDDESVLTIQNEILNNKIKEQLIDQGRLNKIIYAYNYYYRWYNFEIGGAKVSDILLFENKMFKGSNRFDNLINEVFVGNMGVNVTQNFFNSNIGKYTGSSDLRYFLDYIITNIGGYSDVNDWFTEYFGSRNILAEFGVDKNPEILYRGWYQLKKNTRMILPVITLPENCTYIISGPAHLQIGPSQLYHKDVNTAAGKAAVRKIVNDHLNLVKRHLNTLAGSFDPGKWNNYCIMVYDCTKIITSYKTSYFPGTNVVIGTSPVYTQGKVGQNYPFFKNFSEVLGLWQPSGSAAGVGNTAGFLWFIARPGLQNFDTWTHEFEHALFDKIMLFQAGTRFKYGLETLTEGNVEQNGVWSENNLVQDVGPYYFNTTFDLNKEGNATQNLTPSRIDTREKLENYFKGQQNALDLLDYIEGKAFIRLTPEQQARVATRMNQSGGWSTWGAITAAQAEQMNLTSLESLYDNRIIIRPENAWGVSVRGLKVINSIGTNDYGFESVWVNRWYIGHNDNGMPDAFSAKRNYFEMLGYAGVDGYVTYGRGNTATDLDAIQKITKSVTGTAMNWKEYKMSRYATVEENIRNNKYIDVDYMIERFYQALVSDSNRNASQRTNLRKIYYHYLKSVTNDFTDDPLGSTVKVNHIKTAEELVQKINVQPYGYYVLDNDIDFSHMTTNVTQTFMGRLDGKGHKIIGNTLPIFNKIRYGYVGNIHFDGTNIPKTISNAGALSYKAEMSTIEKINVTNLQMNFAGRNDLGLIGGAVSNVVERDCSVEKLTYHIRSVEDMAKLNEDTGGIFVIDNDIDFAGKTYNGTVISNTFTGKINGQGHTLSNLTNASLFANFRGTVENLNIRNFSNTSSGRGNGDFVTAFTQESYTATFRNMRFENITLSGRNNVAVVSGADARNNANSVFENISVKNANVTGTGVYVSTFVGRKYGGKISDVFVQGKLTINSTENGGLVGALQQDGTTVENVVTDVDITKTHNTYANPSLSEINGSMIGNIYDTASIKNSIAFGNMTGYTNSSGVELKPFKFVGAVEDQVLATMTNCYEVLEEIGSSRVSTNTQGKLDSINRKNLNKQFYKNLGFDETVWDLDHLSSKGYPSLK